MEKAETLVQDMSFDQFESDYRTNFAVVRALEIIGEAAKRITDPVRERYDDIPWKSMAGMRDRIIHGYDVVDLRIVWNTVRQDIPLIKPKVMKFMDDYASQE
jgi:uncharacterized protein with HEPN domain